jgi:hypothetical protein
VTAYARDAAASSLLWRGPRGTVKRAAVTPGRFGDAFVFLVPLLLPIEFAVGGRLFLSEVALLVALPFLLYDARRRRVSRISHGVIILGCLWLFGLVVTDIYRGTPFDDYSRGWAKVAFLLLNVAALSLLIDGRWRRVTLFAGGLVIGQVLQFYFNPGVYVPGDPWKFGYGGAVTLAGVLLASRPTVYRRPAVSAGILVALGVINLKMGFRAYGGVCFLAGFFVLLAARSTYLMRLDRRAFRTVTTLAAAALAGLIIVSAYEYVAEHGLLGERAKQKYEAQQSSLGILTGRPEIIVAARAIRDSPIVGHGSWAKDPKYIAALQHELRRSGYRGYQAPRSSDVIPTHSHLFGAWVEAGILGAVFWLWALMLVTGVLPRLHHLADGRVALVAFLAALFLWDVFFSPFGAERRLIMPFLLIVFLLARNHISRFRSQDYRCAT